jgi:hypothetical protein
MQELWTHGTVKYTVIVERRVITIICYICRVRFLLFYAHLQIAKLSINQHHRFIRLV